MVITLPLKGLSQSPVWTVNLMLLREASKTLVHLDGTSLEHTQDHIIVLYQSQTLKGSGGTRVESSVGQCQFGGQYFVLVMPYWVIA